ncbi:signal peptidase II [Candidatus Sumerlaeota bacterium]|nr:signal peptidase II [Candidatus Sumerlaeota bacterium]
MCSTDSPTPPETEPRPGGLVWPLLIAVTLCDQLTKWIMLHWLREFPPPHSHTVIPGLFAFTLKHNTGAAFSMFANHPEILTYVTAVAILIIAWWAWFVPRADRLARTAFALILGGALGNVIDRFARGFVVDFLDFTFPGILGRWHTGLFGTDHFATFNLADTAICLGMGLLILSLILPEANSHRVPTESPEEGESEA